MTVAEGEQGVELTGRASTANMEGGIKEQVATHDQPEQSIYQKNVESFINSNASQTLLNIVTVYALFGDDVKTLAFSGADESKFAADKAFLIVSTFAFALFNLELCGQVYAVPGYFPPWERIPGVPRYKQIFRPLMNGKLALDIPTGSFFFWLDLIATYSLIFELSWLLEPIGGGRDPMLPPPLKTNLRSVDNDYTLDGSDDIGAGSEGNSVDSSAAQSARAGRASRAGAKAGRIVRIVRMVRLIRIVKVFKAGTFSKILVHLGLMEKEEEGGETVSPEMEDPEEEMLPESHVGRSLSELTQRRVIVGVLATLLALPLLEYPYSNDTAMMSTRLAHNFLYRKNVCINADEIARTGLSSGCQYLSTGLETANLFMGNRGSKQKMKLLAGKHIVKTAEGWDSNCLEKLTTKGKGGVESVECPYITSTKVFFDPKNGFNCGKATLGDGVVCSEDSDSANIAQQYFVRKNAHTTVIFKSYDETTGDRYKTVTHWDVTALKVEESNMSLLLTFFVIILLGGGTYVFNEDTKRLVIGPIEQMMESVTQISENPLSATEGVKADASQEGMETVFLLQTIDKIGNLMRIGFGEAGGEIIAKNLKESEDDRLNIQNILTGRGIVSIFGFCDIRNFTDTTECLQQEVMTFVNKVAYVLHNIVKDCKGAANKNIGDAFLLSWKLDDDLVNTKTGEIKKCERSSDYFDNALYAFLKFTVLLRRYDSFITEFSKESNKRLYQRMPDYRCAMGMGLHVGVAVEGAIGTAQKIDATYISLHVNNSEFLESSTKAYKVPLLMSNFFQEHLSAEAKTMTRQIDWVKVTDELFFELWTYDVDYGADYSIEANKQLSEYEKLEDDDMKAEAMRLLHAASGGTDDEEKKDGDSEGDIVGAKEPVPPVITFLDKKKGYHVGVWTEEQDMKTLRHKMAHPDFMESWESVIRSFIEGYWNDCLEHLEKFQKMYADKNDGEKDGPSVFLEKFILSHPKDPSGNVRDDPGHKELERVPH